MRGFGVGDVIRKARKAKGWNGTRLGLEATRSGRWTAEGSRPVVLFFGIEGASAEWDQVVR